MLIVATLGKVLCESIKLKIEPTGLNAEIVEQCLRKQRNSQTCHAISETTYKDKNEDELRQQIQRPNKINTKDFP